MITVSETTKEMIRNGDRPELIVTITNIHEEVLDLTDVNFVDGTFVIDNNCTSSGSFEIGNTEASELTCTLINEDEMYNSYTFEGATVLVELKYGDETIQMGKFVIDERPARGYSMQLRALDALARLHRPCNINNLGFPKSLKNLVVKICNDCNLEFAETDNLPFDMEFEITQIDEPADITYSQLLSWVGEVTLSNFSVRGDRLVFRPLPIGQSQIEIESQNVMDLIQGERDVRITGLRYDWTDIVDYGETSTPEERSVTYGEDDYVIDYTHNKLLHTGNYATVLELLIAKLEITPFRPISTLTIVNDPTLEPMDYISINDVPTIVTKHRWTYGGISDISCDCDSEITRGYAIGVDISDSQRSAIDSMIVRSVTDRNFSKISGFDLAFKKLNENISNSLGVYTTTVTDEDGKEIIYRHDQSTLEESEFIEMISAPGQKAWTTTGWNDGSPIWQYGSLSDGSLIMRIISTIGLNAEWINVQGSPLPTVLNDQTTSIQENTTSIDNLGVRLDEQTYVDGVPLTSMVTDIQAGQIEVMSQINSIKTGGGNLLRNSNFGTSEVPDALWWSGNEIWDDLKLRKMKWSTASIVTWGQMFGTGMTGLTVSNIITYQGYNTLLISEDYQLVSYSFNVNQMGHLSHSFMVYSTVDLSEKIRAKTRFYKADGLVLSETSHSFSATHGLFERKTIEGVVVPDDAVYAKLIIFAIDGDLRITMPKSESGLFTTAYAPNVSAQLTKITSSGIYTGEIQVGQVRISNNEKLTGRLTTINDKILTITDSQNNLSSKLTAGDLTITNATRGVMAGMTLSSDRLEFSSSGSYLRLMGRVGYDPIRIGSSANTINFKVSTSGYLTASGATLSGTITATGGSIGGFTIKGSSLEAGSGSNYVWLSGDSRHSPILVGGTTYGTAKFGVLRDGSMKATSATISGKITSNSSSTLAGSLSNTTGRHDGTHYGYHEGTHYGYYSGQASTYSNSTLGGYLSSTTGSHNGTINSSTGTLGGVRYSSVGSSTLYISGGMQLNGSLRVPGTVYYQTLSQISDEKLKDNIKEVEPDKYITSFYNLELKNFNFRNDDDKKLKLGIIAQDFIKDNDNELIALVVGAKDGYLNVKYENLYLMNILATQELNGRVKKLEEKVNERV